MGTGESKLHCHSAASLPCHLTRNNLHFYSSLKCRSTVAWFYDSGRLKTPSLNDPKAGWGSAVIYSIVGTCRLVGVDPFDYLKWVLPKLAVAKSHGVLGLLPPDFARSKPPDSS